MNGMNVLTVKIHVNDLLQLDGSEPSTFLIFHINSTSIWRLGKHLFIIQP